MRKKDLIKILKEHSEIVRFAVVGVVAVSIHYGFYYLMQLFLNLSVAYTLGYLVGLVCNYYLSARFTFRSSTSGKNAIGFCLCHVINYLLQMLLFNLFLHLQIHHLIAPILVMMLSTPVNFLLVRFVFKSKRFR